MLQKRQIALLDLLLINEKPITGAQLAKTLGVSSRTIRSDIEQIQSHLKRHNILIHSINPKGYYIDLIDKDIVEKMLNELKDESKQTTLPQTPDERMTYILMDLLLHEKQSMQTLSEQLFVTKTTINTDVSKLNESISQGLNENLIKSDSSGIHFDGVEFEIRKRSASWIAKDQDHLNPLIQCLDLFDPSNKFIENTIDIYQMLVNIIEQYQVYLADREVSYLTMFLILSKNRHEKYPIAYSLKHEHIDWIEEVINQSSDLLSVNWTEDDKNSIRIFCDSLSLISTEIVKQDNKDLQQLIDKFLEKVLNFYDIDFRENESLKQFLYVHIRSMFYRLELNEHEYNPLKDDIKKKFPLATEISLLFFNIVKEEKRLMMNDSEISYIALHIASALEVLIEPTRIILVSNLNQGSTRLLSTKLIHFFTNKINIVQTLSVYQYEKIIDNNSLNCDLIVSTSSIKNTSNIPVVLVNPLLFRDDIAHLKRYIHFYSMEMKNQLRFSELFDERLYFRVSNSNNSYYATIRFLVRQLKTFDYIEDEDEYYQLILEREKTFSTVMDNGIAIPHAAENRSRKTVIAVAILNEPLIHEGKKVSIILLNAINEKEDLQNLYQMIEKVLDLESLNDALSAKNLSHFIQIISQKGMD